MRTITRQELQEIKTEQDRLIICGAGHVSLAVIRLGLILGFCVTVIEDRPSFADQARALLSTGSGAAYVPEGNEVICEAFSEALAGEPGSLHTYFVVVTRGHRYDLDCLRSILKKTYAYAGMMSSRGRSARVRSLLLEDGFSQEAVDTLHSPIGLAIQAKTPEEIAVSIIAEIIQVRAGNAPQCSRNDSGMVLTEEIRAAALEAGNMPRLLAVITSRKGSAPRTVGTAMVIFGDGRIAGTIGGGCMEAEVIREALARLHRRTASGTAKEEKGSIPCKKESIETGLLPEEIEDKIEVRMLPEEAEEEGMVCGGIIEVELREVILKGKVR
ncbi:MAG: XdhC family protein [Lachnospiraceae bacterium]